MTWTLVGQIAVLSWLALLVVVVVTAMFRGRK